MTLQGIRTGLLKTLLASGKWDDSELSGCDFGVTEFSASCVIIQPGPNSRFYPIAGNTSDGKNRTYRKEWTIAGIGMVKDKGDPRILLGNLWTLCDDIYSAVGADDTLDESCMASHITLMSRPSIDAFVSDGNVDWGYITFAIEATEVA